MENALDKALTGPAFEKRIKRRNLRDLVAKIGITVGGLGVIGAVLLIMFFLFYVVFPLFMPASIDKHQQFALPGGTTEKTLYYGIDEYQTSGVRFTQSGQMYGFDLEKAVATSKASLPLNGAKITSFTVVNELQSLLAFGLSSGDVIIAKYGYQVSYPDNVKTITPQISYPFGEEPMTLADGAIEYLGARVSDSEIRFVFKQQGSAQIEARLFTKVESMLSDTITLEEDGSGQYLSPLKTRWLMLDSMGRNLYNINADGMVEYIDLSDVSEPKLIETVALVNNDKPSTIHFLLGDYSLMVGTEKGQVLQWFPVRQADNNFKLQFIRSFDIGGGAINHIAIEKTRKGFAVTNQAGEFHLLHSTANRDVGDLLIDVQGVGAVVLSPRANGALIETDNGNLVQLLIENEHPDVSLSSLWGKVWYEGYEEPTYTWQSSSASSDFEPKFSLMPLTWGTIKAALYSMLFAVPIAILAAIYTAFFMDKQTRQWVKPSIEMIEALPTVILGFLAGLWLAPYMESHLPGFFAIFIVVPIGIILFGYGWTKMPKAIRQKVSVGRRAVLMIPVVIFLGWFALQLSAPLENAFFSGDMRTWLTNEAGIDFDQRNAMVIGFAMGFALIPTIFSVAEDAIYNVPAYLVNGSLALGASGWQTLVGVVLPTASPGIFSAIMLGFGRGVGETMIVLMASGNTPLMNANLFEGMRTLSANLAVEMPEAEVASSHYRVLFLSGLVLFIFTFFFNTIAEVVRQRMRRKYGSL
ncbi:phosphate ABC transporter permease [Thiosulfatimonas sediminis]|uniref:Phosphate ABC transporter permease n=1 Tax=Thiosulfatimonas sediminis TaxID=2675054 RepID=A0A6F8PTC7_9GAMM|nr:phosphate ABC transporter permease [Thiosulfatimonas sediminis]